MCLKVGHGLVTSYPVLAQKGIDLSNKNNNTSKRGHHDRKGFKEWLAARIMEIYAYEERWVEWWSWKMGMEDKMGIGYIDNLIFYIY